MKKVQFLAVSGLCALSLAACTPTKAVRGNLLQDYQIGEVVAGVDTQSDVLHKLGSPTTKSPFDDNVWYYIGQETEKRGILDPEVKNERIVAVFFDKDGTVTNIGPVNSSRLDIPYVREKTPTSGSEMTLMQQLLGNLGRFNKDEVGGNPAAGQ